MKIYKLIWILLFLFSISSKAQEIKDLYYAQPKNTGLYLGFIYVNAQNFLLVGVNTIFLFDEKKTIVDTLSLSHKQATFLDNVSHVALIKSTTISISTLQRALLIDVVDNKLKVVRDIRSKDLKQKIGKYDLFALFDKGAIARSNSKSQNHFYFEQRENATFDTKPSMNLTPDVPIVTQFKGSEILGFNKYQKLDNTIFIFRRKQNALSTYNILTKQNEEIKLLDLEDENQLHEFFVDPIKKQCYLFRLSKNEENKIFKLSLHDNSFKLVATTKYIVRGIFDGKMYISGIFDDALAHYLIPLEGQNPDVLFFDN